jgi:hypothetical protein
MIAKKIQAPGIGRLRIRFIQLSVFLCIGIYAQLGLGEVTWVSAEGSAPIIDGAIEAARQLAIQKAREHTINNEVIGADISVEYLWANFRLNGSLAGAIPFARIVESRIESESTSKANKEGEVLIPATYHVSIRSAVEVKTTGEDPEFAIKASVNQQIFRDGQEVRMTMQASEDCYIWVFVIMEDESVLRLIPNRYKRDNALRAGEIFRFPSQDEYKKGMVLKVHAPENQESSDEALYILALKKPRDLRMQGMQVGLYHQYVANNKNAFLADLVPQIVGIPLDQRTETLIRYRIIAK